MSQCHDCRTNRDIETAAAIAELRTEVRGLRADIKDTLITQIKDHGKRISAIERRWWLLMGYMIGSGLIGAAAMKVFL